jgi:hypothetical protein
MVSRIQLQGMRLWRCDIKKTCHWRFYKMRLCVPPSMPPKQEQLGWSNPADTNVGDQGPWQVIPGYRRPFSQTICRPCRYQPTYHHSLLWQRQRQREFTVQGARIIRVRAWAWWSTLLFKFNFVHVYFGLSSPMWLVFCILLVSIA